MAKKLRHLSVVNGLIMQIDIHDNLRDLCKQYMRFIFRYICDQSVIWSLNNDNSIMKDGAMLRSPLILEL